jgi:ATP-binding cassette subfamily C (CFTR/MRP) protein 1
LDAAWDRRKSEAAAWNTRLLAGEIKPGIFKRLNWTLRSLSAGTHYTERRAAYEAGWRESDGKKEASLAWALNDTLGHFFWSAGAFKVNNFVINVKII